jgi:uncharacterized membrane-anchored protein YhcB (DUF1043 family)
VSKKDLIIASLALWVLLGVLFVALIFRWGPTIPGDQDSVITTYKDSLKGLETQRNAVKDSINKTALFYDSLIQNIRSSGDTTSKTLQSLLSKHRQLNAGRN